MTIRGILQIIVGAGLWIGALVALFFGMWIPIVALLGLSAGALLVFAGPSIWQKLRS